MVARDLLTRGTQWAVGNGKSAHIWKDPWVPSIPGFKVFSKPQGVNDIIWVKYLMEEDGPKWKEESLHKWFTTWEVGAIMNIKIPQNLNEDTIAWHYTKNGTFAMRSAYHIELQPKDEESTSMRDEDISLLKHLWKLRIPPKMKNFVWRVLNNGLPFKSKLSARAMISDPMCIMYGEMEESLNHILGKCATVNRL